MSIINRNLFKLTKNFEMENNFENSKVNSKTQKKNHYDIEELEN